MNYEIRKDKLVYYYHVTYDKEKLKEILEKLKDYSYTSHKQGRIDGEITKWPATDNIIKKRVISAFYKNMQYDSGAIYPNTIVHHKEKDSNYVTYEYSFTKLPDLYCYIDLLINDVNPLKYAHLFSNTGKYGFLFHFDQLVLDALLNYVDSKELQKGNSEINPKKQDDYYKDLNELYKQTLECFTFDLIAIKEEVENQEIVNGLSIQKKKVNK